MRDILLPFRFDDLLLSPDFVSRIKLSDDMQQTLASLVGYDGISRRLLRSTMGGVLHTVTPRIAAITHITADEGNFNWVGSDIKTTEVMITGYPTNTGIVWVSIDEPAGADNAWPLGATDVVSFTLDNLNNLNLLIVTNAEKAIIAYTR